MGTGILQIAAGCSALIKAILFITYISVEAVWVRQDKPVDAVDGGDQNDDVGMRFMEGDPPG